MLSNLQKQYFPRVIVLVSNRKSINGLPHIPSNYIVTQQKLTVSVSNKIEISRIIPTTHLNLSTLSFFHSNSISTYVYALKLRSIFSEASELFKCNLMQDPVDFAYNFQSWHFKLSLSKFGNY